MNCSALVIVIKGAGSSDERRARRLAEFLEMETTLYPVDRSVPYRKAMADCWSTIRSRPWSLIYQEGTGIIGGLNCIRAARSLGAKYVVSSGDPIAGFFNVTKGKLVGRAFGVYERALYRHCAGFVGWTPYLTGLALEMGAPRGVTVEGAAQPELFHRFSAAEKAEARKRFGIPEGHLVCGVVGSLEWNPRARYSYGLELVETLKLVKRSDLSVLIVGDGDARDRLEKLVPDALRSRAIFTGRVAEGEVAAAINAMDVGFVTQTLDELGNFRLTTKLPEYLSCGAPVAMSPIPGYFDYVGSRAGWPLPQSGLHPADAEFHRRCAAWLDSLTRAEAESKADAAVEIARSRFGYDTVGPRFAEFAHSVAGC